MRHIHLLVAIIDLKDWGKLVCFDGAITESFKIEGSIACVVLFE